MICPYCSKMIPEDANFCKYCGKRIQTVCPNCGTILKNNALFCSGCGEKVREIANKEKTNIPVQRDGADNIGENAAINPKCRKSWRILAAVLVLLAGTASGFFGAKIVTEMRMSEGAEYMEAADASANRENEEELAGKEGEDSETTLLEDSVNPAWSPENWDPDDYSLVLNPEEFAVFQSRVERFCFFYPKSFYQYRSEEFDENGCGSLRLWSEDSDSELTVWCYERQYDSADDEFDACYSSESAWIGNDVQEILSTRDPSDGGEGRLILSGYGEGLYGAVGRYGLVYLTDRYVMGYDLQFPAETDRTDKSYKWYYTECIYRMCGFSNSSKTYRSYEEFTADDSWEG